MLSPLLFCIVLKDLSKEITLGYPKKKKIFVDDLALVSESIEGPKYELEVWKGALQ